MNGTGATALDVSSFYTGLGGILPESILTIGVVVLLVMEAIAPKGLGARAAKIAIGFLIAAGVASIAVAGQRVSLFSGMIVLDPFTDFFRIFSCAAGIFGAVLAIPSSEVGDERAGEYFSMFLALVAGMMIMAEASDILMIYIGIELVSMMSYVLAGFRRRDRKSAEASLKYVIYGGAASGVMLFGFSLLYGLTGETQLSQMNAKVQVLALEAARSSLGGGSSVVPVALTAGIVLSFAGFAYKIAAVPLHMWSPDVYEGAPTPFTAFLSTGPKAAGFAAMIRFFVVGFSEQEHFETTNLLQEVTTLPWPQLIIVVSLLTMTLGNLAAIGQANIKRFLAYSSIAHAGYALIGLAAFSKYGVSSVLVYMAFYILMNVGAFFAVIWVREKIGSDRIDDYSGLGYRAPFVATTLAICLFSLTGLPPLAGFIGKFFLFYAALDRGGAYPVLAMCAPLARDAIGFLDRLRCSVSGGNAYYWLAVLGLLNSAVSLYYYARVIRKMFLDRPEATGANATPIHEDIGAKLVLGPIAAALLVFGIWWSPVWSWASHATDYFHRPTAAEVTPRSATPSMKKLALPAGQPDKDGQAAAIAP